ncbi:hypothetical protein BC831DRAFT_482844 [Entophlyctis helioformis]|nr:hypothetical protein BC831DRAFT_482844 [Entophlyctis helioformis]
MHTNPLLLSLLLGCVSSLAAVSATHGVAVAPAAVDVAPRAVEPPLKVVQADPSVPSEPIIRTARHRATVRAKRGSVLKRRAVAARLSDTASSPLRLGQQQQPQPQQPQQQQQPLQGPARSQPSTTLLSATIGALVCAVGVVGMATFVRLRRPSETSAPWTAQQPSQQPSQPPTQPLQQQPSPAPPLTQSRRPPVLGRSPALHGSFAQDGSASGGGRNNTATDMTAVDGLDAVIPPPPPSRTRSTGREARRESMLQPLGESRAPLRAADGRSSIAPRSSSRGMGSPSSSPSSTLSRGRGRSPAPSSSASNVGGYFAYRPAETTAAPTAPVSSAAVDDQKETGGLLDMFTRNWFGSSAPAPQQQAPQPQPQQHQQRPLSSISAHSAYSSTPSMTSTASAASASSMSSTASSSSISQPSITVSQTPDGAITVTSTITLATPADDADAAQHMTEAAAKWNQQIAMQQLYMRQMASYRQQQLQAYEAQVRASGYPVAMQDMMVEQYRQQMEMAQTMQTQQPMGMYWQ